tara:strand:- start:496 stop:1227 length:732 start_codon:yes stop_codon:yes gene_type:complete
MILEFQKLLDENEKIVFFTGAGISTESGIPDFRGPKGIWKTTQPIYFQDFIASEEKRLESWERKFSSDGTFASASPNIGHLKISEIMQKKQKAHLITQNVDNLHQDSGVDNSRITELHGNATYAKCLECHLRYELDVLRDNFLRNKIPPICDICGGFIKTATISFGQPMPEEEMRIAQEKTLTCDLFISIGTSLLVFPAAGFPQLAKEVGAKLVIINNQPTDFDHIADLVISEQIGEVFSAII